MYDIDSTVVIAYMLANFANPHSEGNEIASREESEIIKNYQQQKSNIVVSCEPVAIERLQKPVSWASHSEHTHMYLCPLSSIVKCEL